MYILDENNGDLINQASDIIVTRFFKEIWDIPFKYFNNNDVWILVYFQKNNAN